MMHVHLFLPALCEQPAFSAMTFCGEAMITLLVEGVDDGHLEICKDSSLPCDCGCVYSTKAGVTWLLYFLNSTLLKQHEIN